MNDLRVLPVTAINIEKVLSSQKLTDAQKAEYILKNETEIQNVMKNSISIADFAYLMKNRPLIRFRPLRNSFTKRGDRVLLAKSLGISEKEINSYIDDIVEGNIDRTGRISEENLEIVKTYIYRHGTKDQVLKFLDYELSNVNTVLKKLYRTLDDDTLGLAGYFSRPIHRMGNKMLVKLYKIVDKRLKAGLDAGAFSEEKYHENTRWALVKIYKIQNNSKLIQAYKLYEQIK